MARASASIMTPLNLDVASEDYLPPQDLLPHSAPTIDQEKIAPWLASGPSTQAEQPPTPPPKLFGFAHKASISSFVSSSSSRTSRPSDTLSLESDTTAKQYGDTLRPQDARKPSNFSNKIAKLIKQRSRSRLRPELRLNSTAEVPPPLPSPDYIPFRAPAPPSPPPVTIPSKKDRRKHKKSTNIPPPLPPKDNPEPEFKLDTNLDMMDGIIDLTIHSMNNGEASSPSSGFESSNQSSALCSDVSSQHYDSSSINGSSMFSNPFQPASLGTKRKHGPHIDSRKISPKTRPPVFQSVKATIDGGSHDDGDSPSWTAPESWAVDKEGEDEQQYASSDDGLDAPYGRRKRRTITSKLMNGPIVSRPYKIRVYRANGAYHVVSVDLSVTVDELTPQLNKKLLLDPERETHRLYLKERGRERLLALTERPAEIVRRRLDQAGYDVADGLDNLGADDIHFLLKFVYKSNVLGPTEEELHLDNFDNVDLTGRSLKTVPVILYAHAETINSLYLSRNPMLEIPLDFIQSCTSLRVLKLSNMAMKKVPQSVRHCQSLQWLDLSSNRIADLDEAGLDCIPGLRSLKVQNNRMEKLPWYFPKLRSLKELNISNNKFRKLPDVISKTTNLVDLDISFNLIQELPDEIGKLQQLEKLVIVGNKVTRFPPNCSGLENLRTLDCRRNNITDLSVVCLLPKVECILADHNNVFALDLSIGPSLSALDASNNDITQLTMAPGPIGQPYALTSLDISNAKLSSLDQFTLSHLTSLHTLRVCNNSIRSLPETLGDLTQLRHLACSNNQLYTLPSSIGRLQKLEKLEAHNNSLAELPATLWECASLVYLNVTSNLLGAFNEPPVSGTATPAPASSPPNESPLTTMSRGTGLPERKTSSSSVMGRTYPPLAHSLEKLYLGENSLTEDSLHPLIVLKRLKVLNLSFNDIQEIPSGFLKHLPNLEELYLSGNNLSTLPTEDIHRLTDLRVLFLNGNKLQTLPHELGKLKKLTILDVGSNMLKYNINNWEFDWNWNFNPSLRYLNFSGNKRLEIKPDHKAQQFRSHPEIKSLADFSILTQLKVLGLMDVTTTFALNIPDDNEDHRVRTSLSEVNRMPYGIADTLGGNLNMFDLVQPEFRDRKDEAVFALFGRSSHKASSNKLSKYLHDHFLSVFSTELDNLNRNRDERVEDALRRAFLRLNKYLHDFLYDRDPRKPSTVSVSGSSIRTAIDYSSVRSGASGVVMYVVGRKLYVANVGNSLAVISRQGTAELLSTKHDPFDRSETERIRAAEGWVSTKGTVNDEIEVSRSFGFYYLLPVVNARPYISTLDLSELDEFVIIANQGLWDYVPYQTAVDIARPVRGDPMIAAQKLRDFAISYGAEGTTMIMVISVAELFNQGIMRSRQPTADSLIDPEAYTVSRRRPKEIINKDISRLVDEVSPPTGHVALVFTDIRNSTHLWEVNSGMNTAIQMHNHLLRRQLRFCGGYEVKTEGDAFVCSFPTTLAALWWCLSVQLQLLNLGWPLEILECEDGQEIQDHRGKVVYRGLSVRMGIHQGQPLCEPDPVTSRMDYLGPVVNRAARVSGVAAGGQIMCSAEVVREINAAIFETEPPTEHSHRQPSQAVEAIRRMGVVVKPVGEVKLKGLEVSGVLSAVYPADLEARHEIGIVEAHPGTAGSRVQFSIDQMQELALLCIRLETLTRNRIFRPLPKRKGSAANIASDGQIETANPIYLHGNLDVLLPTLDKASDADLMMLLDSLAGRIENALSALTLRQIVALNKGDGGDVSARRNGGMDVRTLQQLLSFLQV